MINTLQLNNRLLNAMVYIDYENIFDILKRYGKGLLEIDFFEIVQGKLVAMGLKIIDTIVFGNFERNSRNDKQQIYLREKGYQTRNASHNGKSCSDLELTVQTLQDLYRNPNIDVFVIVSSDRDAIPLLKAIKYENKFSYLISTQNGFNQVVAKSADYHEYLEDIFDLTMPEPSSAGQDPIGTLTAIVPDVINLKKIRQAREVARYFYHSDIRQRSSSFGKPINLNGYVDVVAKVVHRHLDEVILDFKLAHGMKLVTIYTDPARGLCIKEGPQLARIIK